VPTADVTVPGPDHGPPCAADPQYSDEPPTGLRSDALAGWVAVRKYAAARGVTLCLNDGKRSTAQQLALFQDYVRRYGRAAADDYVLPPAKSAHVKGDAVDVQPATAYRWLQATKGARGWCRIYDNEPWHFEYAAGYQLTGCPARLPRPVR
jgi:LAS superfamily LD-carboxypeptidase LdcB